MISNLLRVIARLEKRSKIEKSESVSLPKQRKMLAITYETGLFFNILLKAMNAQHVLEVGTSVGYSALWLAEAISHNKMKIDGRVDSRKGLITIENDPIKIKEASKNFSEAGVIDEIDIMEGSALENLQKLSRETPGNKAFFDFVFFDADKENLIQYFDLVLPMLRVGGIIATDNVTYPEEYRSVMGSFLKYVRGKPKVQSVTIPIGHGEEITSKCI